MRPLAAAAALGRLHGRCLRLLREHRVRGLCEMPEGERERLTPSSQIAKTVTKASLPCPPYCRLEARVSAYAKETIAPATQPTVSPNSTAISPDTP